MLSSRQFVVLTFFNVIPFSDSAMSPSNGTILCRHPITIKTVFSVFNVSLLEQSQLKILLRSLLISL